MASSTLLLDERFDAEDPRFFDELVASTADKKLASFAERWVRDARPFARRMMLAYVDDGCDREGHRALVKRLFKHAEKEGDDELLGHFLVAFDRLLGRRVETIQKWDWRSRSETTVTRFARDVRGEKVPFYARLPQPERKEPHPYARGVTITKPAVPGFFRFSRATRSYLARRAWRYFRELGERDEARYGKAIRAALALYRDEHLAEPVHLLDAWGLLHALYGGSAVLDFDPRGAKIVPGATLGELGPAPAFPGAWENAFDDILGLLRAEARTVRLFALDRLRALYAKDLAALSPARLGALLDAPDDEARALGAELFEKAEGLERVTVSDWLVLFRHPDPGVLPLVAKAAARALRSDRLALADAITLTCARPLPIAELGLAWLREKLPRERDRAATLRALALVARAENERVRGPAVDLFVAELEREDARLPADLVTALTRDLFDAPHGDARARAAALLERSPRLRDETAIWAALAETPYPDARSFLLRHLAERQKLLLADERRALFASTILAVHGGSRDKRAALRQIAERLVASPAEAKTLLPLAAIALRSVREPERRAAIAAIGRAAFHAPELRAAIARDLPELGISSLGNPE